MAKYRVDKEMMIQQEQKGGGEGTIMEWQSESSPMSCLPKPFLLVISQAMHGCPQLLLRTEMTGKLRFSMCPKNSVHQQAVVCTMGKSSTAGSPNPTPCPGS